MAFHTTTLLPIILLLISIHSSSEHDYNGPFLPCNTENTETKSLTFIWPEHHGAVSSTNSYLCGIVNGYPCPAPKEDHHQFDHIDNIDPSVTDHHICAGWATCREFSSTMPGSIGQIKSACQCSPGPYQGRVNQICQEEPKYVGSSLLFTSKVRPYTSGFSEQKYLDLLGKISDALAPLERRMKYSEPNEKRDCYMDPDGKDPMLEIVNYFGDLEEIDVSDLDNKLVEMKRITQASLDSNQMLCDYKYPVKCVKKERCELSTNDVFLNSEQSQEGKPLSLLQGINIWNMKFGDDIKCNGKSGTDLLNPDLPDFFKYTLKYDCTGVSYVSPSSITDPPAEPMITIDPLAPSSITDPPAEPMITIDPIDPSSITDPPAEPMITINPIDPNPSASPSTTERPKPNTIKPIDCDNLKEAMNIIKQRHNVVNIGQPCDLNGGVKELQDLLKIETTKVSGNEKLSTERICQAFKTVNAAEKLNLCDSSKLLFCKGKDGKTECGCIKEFQENSFGISSVKPTSCLIREGGHCQTSWKIDETSKIVGFPDESKAPMCETDYCVSNGGSYICKEDLWGLLMIKQVNGASQSKAQKPILYILYLLLILLLVN